VTPQEKYSIETIRASAMSFIWRHESLRWII